MNETGDSQINHCTSANAATPSEVRLPHEKQITQVHITRILAIGMVEQRLGRSVEIEKHAMGSQRLYLITSSHFFHQIPGLIIPHAFPRRSLYTLKIVYTEL